MNHGVLSAWMRSAWQGPKDRAQVMHVTGVLRISHEARRPRGGVTTIIRPPAAQTRSVCPGAGLPLPRGGAHPQSLNPLRRTVSSKSASCGPVPRPSSRSPFGPRAQAHHSSVDRIFGSSSRGPLTTPMRRQSDGFAAIAPRQHSVRPLDATKRIVAREDMLKPRKVGA